MSLRVAAGAGGGSFDPASPGPIGGTTPGAGTFTTLASTSLAVGGYSVARVLGALTVPVTMPTDTAENVGYTLTIPGGTMGANGVLRVSFRVKGITGSGNKVIRVRLGGALGDQMFSSTQSTAAAMTAIIFVWNSNSASAQLADGMLIAAGGTGAISSTDGTGTQDTATNKDIVITVQKSTGSDVLVLDRAIVELVSQ